MPIISFDTRGGASVSGMSVADGASFTLPKSVYKEDCLLAGWVSPNGTWCAPGATVIARGDDLEHDVYSAYYYLCFDFDDQLEYYEVLEYGEDYNDMYRSAVSLAGLTVAGTLPIPGPTNVGYTFLYWEATTASSVHLYYGQDIRGLTRGYRMRSVMTPNTHAIEYVLDGGEFASLSYHPTQATFDEWFEVSQPTREGYTLKGWRLTGLDPNVTHEVNGWGFTKPQRYGGDHISLIRARSFMNLSTGGTVTFTAIWEPIKPVIESNIGTKTTNGWKVGTLQCRTASGVKSAKYVHVRTNAGWK